jgi:hypothetical protein
LGYKPNSIVVPAGREKPPFVSYPEICFGNHYNQIAQGLLKKGDITKKEFDEIVATLIRNPTKI